MKPKKFEAEDFENIRSLVGDVSEHDLRNVECYVSDEMGIFIPSTGFCEYAISPAHKHPSYSFVVVPSRDSAPFDYEGDCPDGYLNATAIEPDFPHEERISGSFCRYFAVLISSGLYESTLKRYSGRHAGIGFGMMNFHIERDILIYIKRFIAECDVRGDGSREIAASLASIISHGLIRAMLGEVSEGSGHVSEFLIEDMIEFMHQNYEKKLTLASLSKKANVSESHFSRVFKRETGFSPIDYLIGIRIDKARRLLRDSWKSVTEVAYSCGFGSSAHFSSSFFKATGMTPSAYRGQYDEAE